MNLKDLFANRPKQAELYTPNELKCLLLLVGLKYGEAGHREEWFAMSHDEKVAIAVVDAGFNDHAKTKKLLQDMVVTMGLE